MSVHVKKRADYQPPAFLISTVNLTVNLHPTATRVVSVLTINRQGDHNKPLVLDGDKLTLKSLLLNKNDFSDFTLSDEGLTINTDEDTFELEIHTEIDPKNNKALEGLYLSGGAYCTQCEAEGFRRITYFMDRPDILAVYTVTVVGDTDLPMLLSNGNPVDKGQTDDGKHFVTWHDPHPKPSYLFALVAGDFDLLSDTYTTMSGKEVALELYVDKGKKAQGHFALASLKRAMKWDEDVFGLEYDLDIYMIVAVDFFNMGAMENKGLNVFNSKFVLAEQASATDDDFFNVESVIAHEYFHNWTGNRVTCRDWFQLSLKEGLTVFRDQQFSADMTSPLSNRIKHVRVMREHQFAEDASAMSHPIRPDEVIEMNNFYTVTVYDKGAEVIRMFHTLLGPEGFRRGMDEYIKRHDGQAVTIYDFVGAMEDANGVDLTQFKLWYKQAGTPVIDVQSDYDADAQVLRLTLRQNCPDTPGQSDKKPMWIPLQLGLIGADGGDMPVNVTPAEAWTDASQVLHLTEAEQTFVFSDVKEQPVVSLLRDFSAPVKVNFAQSDEELLFRLKHDSDGFNRWDAGQRLMLNWINAAMTEDFSLSDEARATFVALLISIIALGLAVVPMIALVR